jgi:hypothetical protein
MTASRAAHHEAISAEAIFRERCEARVILFAADEFNLHVAVDVLQEDAERSGLVKQIRQDSVQRMMADAFHSVCKTQEPPTKIPDHNDAACDDKRRLPISTIRAAEFLIQQNDPERLRAWLATHTRAERLAIRRYFEQKEKQK